VLTYTVLFLYRSWGCRRLLPSFPARRSSDLCRRRCLGGRPDPAFRAGRRGRPRPFAARRGVVPAPDGVDGRTSLRTGRRHGERRSEEHTSELQSRENLVCRLLLEKKKNKITC